jgi:hypothetical protein
VDAHSLNELAPFLGVLLVAIGTFFAYKQAETKRAQGLKEAEKMPALLQTAAFAGEHAPRLIADAITDGFKCLCEAVNEFNECNRQDQRDLRNFRAELLEKVGDLERNIGIIAKLTRQREDREGP